VAEAKLSSLVCRIHVRLRERMPSSSHTCAIAFAHTTRAHSNKHLPLHPTAIMRLTAELISNSLSYLNPLKERELDLRGMPYTLTVS
jgi:hypothetical protein